MIETIGEALSARWQVHARCDYGNREGLKSIRRCTWRYQLDLDTLVATRGRDFPVARVAERLRCPWCGSRKVAVLFTTPGDEQRSAADGRR
jgi:hypothetical protein